MKKLFILSAVLFMFNSCSQSTLKSKNHPEGDPSGLTATMRIINNDLAADKVTLKFTVKNASDSSLQFCKWHTPFEPLMSKYLDIKTLAGIGVDYKGAMAKRIMPPPPDSYIEVKPGDSLSIDVDLLKGYAISKPATYILKYSGGNMSGLVVKDSVIFECF